MVSENLTKHCTIYSKKYNCRLAVFTSRNLAVGLKIVLFLFVFRSGFSKNATILVLLVWLVQGRWNLRTFARLFQTLLQ